MWLVSQPRNRWTLLTWLSSGKHYRKIEGRKWCTIFVALLGSSKGRYVHYALLWWSLTIFEMSFCMRWLRRTLPMRVLAIGHITEVCRKHVKDSKPDVWQGDAGDAFTSYLLISSYLTLAKCCLVMSNELAFGLDTNNGYSDCMWFTIG